MNIKRFIASVIAVFFIFGIVDFIFDLLVLGHVNGSMNTLWRLEPIRWLEPGLFMYAALLFVLIFAFIYKGKGMGEWVMYGILTGLLVNGVLSLRQYMLYPISFILTVIWFIEGMIQYILAGVAAALIYRPRS
jgi:hypothetical protein